MRKICVLATLLCGQVKAACAYLTICAPMSFYHVDIGAGGDLICASLAESLLHHPAYFVTISQPQALAIWRHTGLHNLVRQTKVRFLFYCCDKVYAFARYVLQVFLSNV